MTLFHFHNLALDLKHSKNAIIGGFDGDQDTIERLKEMGLYEGLQIESLGQAPLAGPQIFRFANTILALRKEEALCVILRI